MKPGPLVHFVLSSIAAAALLAPGCGGKAVLYSSSDAGGQSSDTGPSSSNATCESACASCPQAQCVDGCHELQTECQAAGQAALFQTYVNCVAASNCAFDPKCGQPPTCFAIPDSSAPPDSRTPPPPIDAGPPPPPDSGTDGNIVGPPMCYANAPYAPPAWQPPTPFSTTACTPAEVDAWINSLYGGAFPPMSGSGTCDACLLTMDAAPAYGPVVYDSVAGPPSAYLNEGGCIAHFDGMTAAGSCGDQYNRATNCALAECAPVSATQPGCPDFNTDGPMTQACEAYAFGQFGLCNAYVLSSSCAAEIDADGGPESVCIAALPNGLAAFLTMWCG